MMTLQGRPSGANLASYRYRNFTAAIYSAKYKRRYLTMSKKNSVKKYFTEMLVEYGKVLEQENRAWSF